MNDNNPVKDLFPEPEESLGGRAADILESLGKYGIRNLAYDGEIGCNPGYIFRGEAAFPYPLQCSLERTLREQPQYRDSLTGEQLRVEEKKYLEEFLKGEGQRLAAIVDQQCRGKPLHSWNEVWWWLSLMQHYEEKTRLIDFTRDIRLALFFAIEQHDRRRKSTGENLDLVIYCFPCKDLKHSHDATSNKCPFLPRPNVTSVDMNMALGIEIGVSWMEQYRGWFPDNHVKKKQLWGWDRHYYLNPRLNFQKGMFVYPYDSPKKALKKEGGSWLVQNLRSQERDLFSMKEWANDMPAQRIRIDKKHAPELKTYLHEWYELSEATVYLDYRRLKP